MVGSPRGGCPGTCEDVGRVIDLGDSYDGVWFVQGGLLILGEVRLFDI